VRAVALAFLLLAGCALEDQSQSVFGRYDLAVAPSGGTCNLTNEERREGFDQLVFRIDEGPEGPPIAIPLLVFFADDVRNADISAVEVEVEVADDERNVGVLALAIQQDLASGESTVELTTIVELQVAGVEVAGRGVWDASNGCRESFSLRGLRQP
jgi:hypothetical protein